MRKVPRDGNIEKILKQEMSVLGGDALRMELDAVDRKPDMRKPHDEAIIGLRR
jgi:hypothetical protein